MELKLYHYVHCPFCVRVRMALGHLNLPYESIVVPYDDEITPVKLTGKKMLPIMTFNGTPLNESLDIIKKLDQDDKLHLIGLEKSQDFRDLNLWLTKLGENIHSLAMPYWIYTPEFNDSSRNYFLSKKEKKRGPFRELIKHRNQFEETLLSDLEILSTELKPFFRSDKFTGLDVLLASHLWGMYVVPEFRFPDKIHDYLQTVKNLCHFSYHSDFWV